MDARREAAARPRVRLAGLAAVAVCGCLEEPRSLWELTDDPVVMGISLSVVEDGPYAADLAPLPANRPRAEVLPLDVVELDALVANVDGPLALDEAVWVLCGDGCLGTMAVQGRREGVLPPCTVDAASHAWACLAGRGVRPRVVLPAVYPPPEGPWSGGVSVFVRMAVIAGGPGGPTTDECLQQLLLGPRTELWGCAVGVKELRYGPEWTLQQLLPELGYGDYTGAWSLPPLVTRLLPPNAAPWVEQVRLGAPEDFTFGEPDEHIEPRSVHEVLEIEAGTEVMIEPVVSEADQQLVLVQVGPQQWVGRRERIFFAVWSDAPVWRRRGYDTYSSEHITLTAPADEGPVRLYVVVHDSRDALSWFELVLQVVAR
jgi:hypothetical protein